VRKSVSPHLPRTSSHEVRGHLTGHGSAVPELATPGTTVCSRHLSGAPNTAKNGEVRMTLAQLLKENPRPIGVAMMDAVATADAIFRDAKLPPSVRLT
jgi:hypothetical protein